MRTDIQHRVVNAGLLLSLMLMTLLDSRSADSRPIDLPVSHSATHDTTVGQGNRWILHEEIWRAITDDLARKGIAWGTELRVDDLAVQTLVPGVGEDNGLRVKSIRVDPYRSKLVFELCTSNPSQSVPFTVTTPLQQELISRLGGGAGVAAGIAQPQSPMTKRVVNSPSPPAPILAVPGTVATLFMVRPNARVTTTVVPLQRGVKGQSILVRDLGSARVMTAVVIDQNLLQTGF